MVGLVLIVVPWTALWEGNQLLQPYPAVRQVLMNGFTRGAVTGLGLVNLLLGLQELHEAWDGHGRHT
jgi:hypothetical protein